MEGDANGVQLSGLCNKVDESKYEEIIPLFFNKMNRIVTHEIIQHKINEYKDKGRAIYVITPHNIYIQDQDYFKNNRVDKRIEVILNK